MAVQQSARALAALAAIVVCPLVAMAGTPSVTTVPVPDHGRPAVARTDADGTIHLLYDSGDGPKYATSNDNGTTLAPAMSVLASGSRTPGLEFAVADMAVGKGGRIHVAMSTNAWKLKLPEEDWGFQYTTLDPGSAAFTPVRNINRKPSEGFSLAADERGNVTACWLSGKLYANVSRDNGETFGPNTELDPRFDPCNCCTTSSVYGADGKLALLYREETNNDRDMYLVLWDQDRGKIMRTRLSRTPWNVDACPMTYYAISRDRAGFAAVWPTRGRIYFEDVDAKGAPGAEIQTPGKSGMRTGMLALRAPDGTMLIAWKNADRLGWQAYGAIGEPLGAPGSAPSSGNGVAGVVDRNGRFILFR
jgi:hypothetical protein